MRNNNGIQIFRKNIRELRAIENLDYNNQIYVYVPINKNKIIIILSIAEILVSCPVSLNINLIV